MTSAPRKRCDIIVPVYNEAGNLQELHRQVTAVMQVLPFDYVLLFVDDGSTDETPALLECLAQADPRVKFLSFTRNFGHQAALAAGLEHAGGDCVVTMDGDLQHPPQCLPEMLRLWEEGYRVVSTVRGGGAPVPLLKRQGSALFYRLFNRLTDLTLMPGTADFGLLDREVVSALIRFRERGKFLRGLVSWFGFRSTRLTYRAQDRFAGEPKYSLLRMTAFAWDGITAFSAVPLRLAGGVGLAIAAGSFLFGVYAICTKLAGGAVQGWTSILISVTFLGGLQLMFIGLLGEYIARIFEEVKQRPLYVVKHAKL